MLTLSAEKKTECDIEDLFAEKDYLAAVNDVYRAVLRDSRYTVITKSDLKAARSANRSLKRIVPTLEEIWEGHAKDGWGSFDKTQVCYQLCRGLFDDGKLTTKVSKRFEELFVSIQEAIAAQSAEGAEDTDIVATEPAAD